MKKLAFLFCIPFLTLNSCDNDQPNEELIFCTTQFVYGLNVTVKDAQTNEVLTNGVVITATDGGYSENLELFETNDYFLGAGERAGNYTLTVSKDGYITYVSDVITLTRDVCHVIPKQIEVKLTPQ